MIKQLIYFKFKEKTPSDLTRLFFSKYKKLESLDCLTSIEYGKNISKEGYDKGFTHGAIAKFKNREMVNIFLKHKRHTNLVDKYLDPILEDFMLIEIEA